MKRKNPKNTEEIFSNIKELLKKTTEKYKRLGIKKISIHKIKGGLRNDLSIEQERVKFHIEEMEQGIFDTKKYPVNLIKIGKNYYVGDNGHKRIFTVFKVGKKYGIDYVYADVEEKFLKKRI